MRQGYGREKCREDTRNVYPKHDIACDIHGFTKMTLTFNIQFLFMTEAGVGQPVNCCNCNSVVINYMLIV